jgi:predicted DNA-binding transcriptional regulator AlpA
MKDSEIMLDVKQQSQLTGLSPKTLYNWKTKGIVPWPTYQVGAFKWVARKADVLKWLEAVKVPAGSKYETVA